MTSSKELTNPLPKRLVSELALRLLQEQMYKSRSQATEAERLLDTASYWGSSCCLLSVCHSHSSGSVSAVNQSTGLCTQKVKMTGGITEAPLHATTTRIKISDSYSNYFFGYIKIIYSSMSQSAKKGGIQQSKNKQHADCPKKREEKLLLEFSPRK